MLPIDEAKKRGAIGIFEEKYGDVVRMLTMTRRLDRALRRHARVAARATSACSSSSRTRGSRRACGASKRRRGGTRSAWCATLERTLAHAAALLKAAPADLPDKVERALAHQKEQEREIEALKKKLMSGGSRDYASDAKRTSDGVTVLGAKVEIGDAKALRELADQLRDKHAPAVVLVGTEGKGGKVFLACSVSGAVTDRFQAGAIVKRAAELVGGGGGGRADFAQAGGSDASKLDQAVQSVYEAVPLD